MTVLHSVWSSVDDHYSRRSHLLVESADRSQGFALFGGFRPRHRFAGLYLPAGARTRTRLVVHQPITASDCRRLVQDHGLVVFCGDVVPPALTSDLLTIPLSVDLEIPTPSVFDGPSAQWSRSAKANISKIKRHRFAYDVVDSREWVREFREHMLVPSAHIRHGARASLDSRRKLANYASTTGSELLRVMHDGRWVGASLNESTPAGYRMRKLGWLNGDEALHKSGVVSALYWFTFQRAAALGHHRILMGSVDPILEDGIFRYKSFWGGRLSKDSRDFSNFRLLLEPSHPSCRRFLQTHSLITRAADRQFIVFSGRSPDVAAVTPEVLSGVARWYLWRDEPSAVPETRSDEVPASLRPWVSLAVSTARR